MKKIVSFDMDSTLFDEKFDEIFWLEEIPRLYSERHKVSFEKAKEICLSEFNKETKFSMKWYDPEYWFGKFQLSHPYKKVLSDLKHRIYIYSDTIHCLKSLRQKYFLVLVSAAPRDFMDLKLEVDGAKGYFDKIISTTSDMGIAGKSKMVFRKVVGLLGAGPKDIIHVGDNMEFDFNIPRSMGVTAYLIDREKKHKPGEFVIHSLRELEGKLL